MSREKELNSGISNDMRIIIPVKNTMSIGKAAKLLGISVKTLRRWEREGRLIPIGCSRVTGNQNAHDRRTIGFSDATVPQNCALPNPRTG
ncbi:MerR family DNA-binding transcriptional regulator [Giesbergeria sp.]|uniref:MerR family DNA-binding transcriptional regulator n=1 Tax=Giesbergeria sp. TaxID=2818473 RepID=UPI0034190C61